MKKLFFAFILIISILDSFAQKSKRIRIHESMMLNIGCRINFSEDGSENDTLFYILGRDSRYSTIELITLQIGTIKEICDFLKYSSDFYKNEEVGISENYNGCLLSLEKIMAIKQLWIHEEEGSGYTIVSGSQLDKALNSIKSWASKNKVSID